MPLPACEAVMLQVPAETKVTVAPFAPPVVHTPVDVEAKVTGRPDAPPVADSATVPAGAKIWVAGGVKLITCVACPIVKLFVTGVAVV